LSGINEPDFVKGDVSLLKHETTMLKFATFMKTLKKNWSKKMF